MSADPDTFQTLFKEAVDLCGGNETRLATAAGCSQNAIWHLKKKQRASPEMALRIEKATKGIVPRWKLRPDLWSAPADSPPIKATAA